MFNDVQASQYTAPGRIVVIGDVHGDIHRFLQCLYAMRIFNTNLEWIAEPKDTIVIQLGDQIDSLSRGGSSTWEQLCDVEMIHLTDRLDRIARMGGGRVLSLLGNHELMNVAGEFSYVSEHSKMKLPLERRKSLFQPGGSVARILAKRNVIVKIGAFLFCHGGVLPHHLMLVENNFHKINDVVRKFLRGSPLEFQEYSVFHHVVEDMGGVLWTRMYMELAQASPQVLNEAIDDVLQRTGSKAIFSGHNTVPQVTPLLGGKVFLTDAGLSRAYGSSAMQCVQIVHPGTDAEQIQITHIKPTGAHTHDG